METKETKKTEEDLETKEGFEEILDNVDDEDEHALLNILQEKDNLIVSLKEASTKRDKLNEKQIRMLSEDNQKKTNRIRGILQNMNALESKARQKEAELAIFKVEEGKLVEKVEEVKVGFKEYKTNIRGALDKIKSAITDEFARREEYKDRLLENMQEHYQKLENQVKKVDDYYKEVITDISKKQSMSKKYIRNALNDLQEALAYLDLSQADLVEPIQIKEEFSRVLEESSDLFKEFKELKGHVQGATIIKNIENVNIELSEAPVVEGVFREIDEIRKVVREGVEVPVKAKLKAGEVEVAPVTIKAEKGAEARVHIREAPGKGKGDQGAGGGGGAMGTPGKSTGEGKEAAEATGKGKGGEGAGGGGGAMGTPGKGTGEGKEAAEATGKGKGGEGAGGGKETAGAPGGGKGTGTEPEEEAPEKKKGEPSYGPGLRKEDITEDRAEVEVEEPEKKKASEDFQEVVFKRGRNYAPFNWREILNTIQLERFHSIVESCIKAEKEGKFLKALGLYKTIQEQPGIAQTIAGKLLEDHIEYLEDIIKKKYSFYYKPAEPIPAV